jgi:hypothetical protein
VPEDDAALPPGEHGPAAIALHLEGPRGDVLFEPHELTAVVEDHGPVLPGALLQGQKDVAGGGTGRPSGHLRRGGGQVGARTEGPDALGQYGRDAGQGPDLRDAQRASLRDTRGPQLPGAPVQSAAVRQGEESARAQRPQKAASR